MTIMELNGKSILNQLNTLLPTLKEKYGVKKIGLFGSYIKKIASPTSDIDILVEFDPHFETFDTYMNLKFFLEDEFHKSIDLVIEDSMKARIKDQILQEVVFA